MKYQLIALDLDGTVLTNSKQVTERTKSSLRLAARAGMEIVLVTGRPFMGLPRELTDLPFIRYAITSNGAVSTDLSNGTRLRSALISNRDACEILRLPVQSGLIYNVFLDGIGYCDKPSFDKLLGFFVGTPLEGYVRDSRRPVEDVFRLTEEHPEGVENIWIMGRDREERDRLGSLIQNQWHLNTVFTAGTDVEIGVPEADKGAALRDLASSLGIGRDAILAFGDNENDLGMFRAAGTAVAMGNASDSVRQSADLVTASNEQDGVARMIEELL
ncbi:MAG: HAD family phosphatase [Parasporobacterium sp.]|nr:HAD family phosphatase [Parasporobacterium sp.]